jgi:hypothetical protein
MNKQEAYAKKLHYTGISDRSKEVVKNRIKEEMRKYPGSKLYLVTERVGKYSRSEDGSIYYNAYADDVYQAHRTIEDTRIRIEGHQATLDRLQGEYF